MVTTALAEIAQVLEQGVQSSLFSAAASAVVTPTSVDRAFVGRRSFEPDAVAIGPESMFDLASLTKVVATAPAVMHLVESGTIALDQPVADLIEEFARPSKRKITIDALLCHMAGFGGPTPLYQTCKDSLILTRQFLEVEPVFEAGARRVYDDVSYVVLGILVERVTGMSLADFCHKHVFVPAAMQSTMFGPLAAKSARSVPTEVDPERGLLQGVVHDENAYYLGEAAGHAGLFSTLDDLAKFCGAALLFGNDKLLEKTTWNLMRSTRWRDESGKYLLTWDGLRPSYMGRIADADAFGHTGFTGTSIVLSPRKRRAIILLTNFVHPKRKPRCLIDRVRRRVAEIALR